MDCALSIPNQGKIHFVGIGGIGMSALARLLLHEGRLVSGSDKAASNITEELAVAGADIFIGHKAENIDETVVCLVVSTAITKDNPEYAEAVNRKIPILHRSEVLTYLARDKKTIAISGTHGKTTTTGMVSQVLLDCGLEPTVVVGGIFEKLGSNSYAGNGEYFVLEADESDRSHARTSSEIAVVTNIEPDHMENYPGGIEQILDTMATFANQAKKAVVLCVDDLGCKKLVNKLQVPIITYALSDSNSEANYKLKDDGAFQFSVSENGNFLGKVNLKVPGKHNKLNALCTIAVARQVGLDFNSIANSLSTFNGVARRFQIIGEVHKVTLVDDYGHHPTEVMATLEAAQVYRAGLREEDRGRVVAIFQPHQPGRLRDLWSEFTKSFKQADLVIILDIYVARGGNIEGINSKRFSHEIENSNVTYIPGPINELSAKISPLLQEKDIVLTIGAGDITNLSRPLLEHLQASGLHRELFISN